MFMLLLDITIVNVAALLDLNGHPGEGDGALFQQQGFFTP